MKPKRYRVEICYTNGQTEVYEDAVDIGASLSGVAVRFETEDDCSLIVPYTSVRYISSSLQDNSEKRTG